MNIRISKLATQDLEGIWLYTFETWSVEQADRYIDLILNEIEYLSVNPKYGLDFQSIRKGYFRAKIKSHLIFYRIDEKNAIIEVIRILHQRMDIDNRLK